MAVPRREIRLYRRANETLYVQHGAVSGGQVGDVGTLAGDKVEFEVIDTQKDGDLWVHVGTLKRGKLSVGQTVAATVDAERRSGIRRAHSATHILHHALRQTLGSQATQRGSKVDRDVLRFDFTHGKPVSDEELQTIETEINTRIAEGAAVTTKLMPIAEARELGAMALFRSSLFIFRVGNSEINFGPRCFMSMKIRRTLMMQCPPSSGSLLRATGERRL